MKTAYALILAAALAAQGSAALAHSDDYLDSQTTPNGGQQRMAGAYHLELVVAKDSKQAKENPLVVYVTDHAGAKVATAGGSGSATLLAGKTKLTAALTPDGDNRLRGTASYASTANLKVVVSVALPGRAVEQARFTPLVKSGGKDSHAGH